MLVLQFLNTIYRISKVHYKNKIISLFKHFIWQVRKLFSLFPFEQKLSNSIIIAKDKYSGVSALINCLEMYDYNNMNLIKVLLKEGGNFIDIGANIGSYTLIASEQENTKVYSFEPHPKTYSFLEENININQRKNIKIFNFAVFNKTGHSFFSNYSENSINHILKEKVYNSLTVRSIRLDSFLEKNNIIPDIVKIDVEGFEYEVLSSIGTYFKDVKVFFIEQNELDRNLENDKIVNLMIQNEFEGPFSFDFRNYCFKPYIKNFEDCIYIARNFKKKLLKLSISFQFC